MDTVLKYFEKVCRPIGEFVMFFLKFKKRFEALEEAAKNPRAADDRPRCPHAGHGDIPMVFKIEHQYGVSGRFKRFYKCSLCDYEMFTIYTVKEE